MPTRAILIPVMLISLLIAIGCGDGETPTPDASTTKSTAAQQHGETPAKSAAVQAPGEEQNTDPEFTGQLLAGHANCSRGLEEYKKYFNLAEQADPDKWWQGFQPRKLSGRSFKCIGDNVYFATTDGVYQFSEGEVRRLGKTEGGAASVLGEWKGTLVAAGGFSSIGRVESPGIARWNGKSWDPIGAQFEGGVNAVAEWKDRLVIGGTFSSIDGEQFDGIAIYEEGAWTPLGQVLRDDYTSAKITDILASGDRLFICGDAYILEYEDYPPQPCKVLEFVDGKWQKPYSGNLAVRPNCLEIYQGSLVVGFGSGITYEGFDRQGELINKTRLAGMARLVNGKWIDFGISFGTGDKPPVDVLDMKACGNDLYVSGWFEQVDGQPCAGIFRWDGSSVSQPPTQTQPTKLEIFGGGLLLGGLNRIWIEDEVYSMDAYLGDRVWDVVVAEGTVYAVHESEHGRTISAWTGFDWNSVAYDLPARARVQVVDDVLYVFGPFESVNGVAAVGIARFDGQRWHAVGKGLGSWVGEPVKEYRASRSRRGRGIGAIGAFNGDLVAVGNFTHSGERPVAPAVIFREGQWQDMCPEIKPHYSEQEGYNISRWIGTATMDMVISEGGHVLLLASDPDGGSPIDWLAQFPEQERPDQFRGVSWDGSVLLPAGGNSFWNRYNLRNRIVDGELVAGWSEYGTRALGATMENPISIKWLENGRFMGEAFPDYFEIRPNVTEVSGELFVHGREILVARGAELIPLIDLGDERFARRVAVLDHMIFVVVEEVASSYLVARAWK